MGAGRSGSTTLGITLGNCEDVFYAGELDNWLRALRRAAGRRRRADRFWERRARRSSRTRRRARRAVRQRVPARDRALAVAVSHSQVAGSRAAASPLPARSPRTSTGRSTRAATVTPRGRHLALPAARVASCSGSTASTCTWCSWSGTRRASSRRSTATTSASSRSRPLHTNVYLWVTHLLSLLVFLRHPRERRLLVRYERLHRRPGGVVRRDPRGQPDAPDTSRCRTSALADVGFPLQGNRVTRGRTTISLKPQQRPGAARIARHGARCRRR